MFDGVDQRSAQSWWTMRNMRGNGLFEFSLKPSLSPVDTLRPIVPKKKKKDQYNVYRAVVPLYPTSRTSGSFDRPGFHN
jgi:hypothetical protein